MMEIWDKQDPISKWEKNRKNRILNLKKGKNNAN